MYNNVPLGVALVVAGHHGDMILRELVQASQFAWVALLTVLLKSLSGTMFLELEDILGAVVATIKTIVPSHKDRVVLAGNRVDIFGPLRLASLLQLNDGALGTQGVGSFASVVAIA